MPVIPGAAQHPIQPSWSDAGAIAGGVLFGMFVIWLNRLAARRMREHVARLSQPVV
jgi:hypothetical protein